MLSLLRRKTIAAAQALSFVCCFVIGCLILKFVGTAQGVDFVLAPTYEARNSQHVAIVHIDARTVEAWRAKFEGEMAPEALVQLLSTVAELQPRAIYLDVQLLSNKYGSVVREAEEISAGRSGADEARLAPIPVLLARKLDRLPAASEIRFKPQHAVISPDAIYAENSYRLWPVNELGEESASPAVRLAQAYCPGCEARFERPNGSSMAMRWPAQSLDASRGCQFVSESRLAEAWERLLWLAGGVGKARKPATSHCQPFLAFSAVDLMSMTGDSLAELRVKMRERVVIIGENDKPVLLTPAGYDVSRPWVHAAAYENLATFGHTYWQPPENLLRVLVTAVLLSAVLMFGVTELSSLPVLKSWYPGLNAHVLALLIAAATFGFLSIFRWPMGDRLSWAMAAAASFVIFIRLGVLREEAASSAPKVLALVLLIGGAGAFEQAYAENGSDKASASLDLSVRLIGFRQGKDIRLEKSDGSKVKLGDVFCSLRKDEDGFVATKADGGLEFRVFAAGAEGAREVEYSVHPLDVIVHESICVAEQASSGPSEINGNRACYAKEGASSRPSVFQKECSAPAAAGRVDLKQLKPFSVKKDFTHREILSRTTVKGITQVALLDEKLNTLLVRLTKNLPVPVSDVRINVVASKDAGQSDVRGGIYLGWEVFEKLESDDVLAALVAHELAHVLLRHGDEGKYTQVASNALRVMALRALVEKEDEDAGRFAVADLVSTELLVPFWEQREESAADRLAVEILALAGYNLYGMHAFVQKVSADKSTAKEDSPDLPCSPKEREQALDLFRKLGLELGVHPRSSKRINDVADYIRTYHNGAASSDQKAATSYKQWFTEASQAADYRELVTVRRAVELMVCKRDAQAAQTLDELLQQPGTHQMPTQVIAALAYRGARNNVKADKLTEALLQSREVPLVLIADLIEYAGRKKQPLIALELSRRVRREYYFPRDFYPVLLGSYANAAPAVREQLGPIAAAKLFAETKKLQFECTRNQDKLLSVECLSKSDVEGVVPIPDLSE